MDSITIEKKKYEHYLSQCGVKLTSGRKAVFKKAMDTHGHFCTEDLVKQCQHIKPKVSRATVYRSIKELLAAGCIRATAYGEKHQNFEHVYDEKLHHHARCIQCQDILELPDLKEDDVYRPLLKNKGFKILGHEMHFYGICKSCR